jgi:hypothetical protein
MLMTKKPVHAWSRRGLCVQFSRAKKSRPTGPALAFKAFSISMECPPSGGPREVRLHPDTTDYGEV